MKIFVKEHNCKSLYFGFANNIFQPENRLSRNTYWQRCAISKELCYYYITWLSSLVSCNMVFCKCVLLTIIDKKHCFTCIYAYCEYQLWIHQIGLGFQFANIWRSYFDHNLWVSNLTPAFFIGWTWSQPESRVLDLHSCVYHLSLEIFGKVFQVALTITQRGCKTRWLVSNTQTWWLKIYLNAASSTIKEELLDGVCCRNSSFSKQHGLMTLKIISAVNSGLESFDCVRRVCRLPPVVTLLVILALFPYRWTVCSELL